MVQEIDFGEPRDKYWLEELGFVLSRLRGRVIESVGYPELRVGESFDCPWEELGSRVKEAVYSIRMGERFKFTRPKHGWVWERSKEIRRLRRNSFYQLLLAIVTKEALRG